MNLWFRLGAFFMMTGVALGAFGAHGLKGRLSPEAMQIYQTAVFYQLIHAMGLFVVAGAALTSPTRPAPALDRAGIVFGAGIVIFSGSLYLLAMTGLKWLGAVTPIGGLLFLFGWGTLAFQKIKH